MSRVDQPKQFQPTAGTGSASFFQATLLRHRGPGFETPIVVTNFRHGPIVNRQMRELQMAGTVIAEPVGRNTGPAVLAAALTVLREDPDALLLVLPSDHVVKGEINGIVRAMAQPADEGRIVAFGIPPRYPETGYGYITDGGASLAHDGLHEVRQFIEKPPLEQARTLVTSGNPIGRPASACSAPMFWSRNTGGSTRRPRFWWKRRSPARHARAATARATHILLDEPTFKLARNEPTERAVFEVSDRIALAPLRGIEWDDVGAWSAVHRISERNEAENLLSGDVIAIDTRIR